MSTKVIEKNLMSMCQSPMGNYQMIDKYLKKIMIINILYFFIIDDYSLEFASGTVEIHF